MMKDVIVHRQQIIPEFCWGMLQHLRCETHIISTLVHFQPKDRAMQLRQIPQSVQSNRLALPHVESDQQRTNPQAYMQKHFHEVEYQYVFHWVEVKISANLSILKQYRETFEVDPFSKHVLHDDEDSEFAKVQILRKRGSVVRLRNALSCFNGMDG